MGRSWQFFLTVAIVVAGASYAYYSSDYYAQRSSGAGAKPAAETSAPAEGGAGIIPSNK